MFEEDPGVVCSAVFCSLAEPAILTLFGCELQELLYSLSDHYNKNFVLNQSRSFSVTVSFFFNIEKLKNSMTV
jgi:hypothetical protein